MVFLVGLEAIQRMNQHSGQLLDAIEDPLAAVFMAFAGECVHATEKAAVDTA
jgi:hypothetical protein